MKYQDWQKDTGRFRAMTGYDLCEFNELLPYFEAAHDEYLNHYYLNGKPRSGRREHVIYENSPLPCHAERLAFILSYLKLNPIQEQHADSFSMTQKQCHEFVHGLNKILQRALKVVEVVPANSDHALQEVLNREAISPEDKLLLHDGTEREIPRPVDDDLQKEQYSGKKKKHTVKNAVIITSCCLVLYVSRTFPGRIHDKTIADSAYIIPAGYTLAQDSGYQVYRPEGVKIIQPQKKPKGKDLTEEQKEENRRISSFRVRVEHAIGSVKRYRIVKDECRLRKNNFVDDIFLYCAALHNSRLKTRPFAYENNLT
jgi:hypothetical protein